MAKRPSADSWLAARQRWESDPTQTFESIALQVGVSRQAACKRAEKEGWARPANLRQINERAQLQADAKVASKPVEVDSPSSKTLEQAAVDVRAHVLEKHRTDWISHRALFTLADIAADFDRGKQAKISAEMLLLRQKGEREAYGLGNESLPPNDPAKVVRELIGSLHQTAAGRLPILRAEKLPSAPSK
jgi:hypothetical protein